MNRINIFLLLFSIVITDNIFAQVFTNYTSEPSTTLLENQISSIAIDSLGNKWFGTMAGASKFDGKIWTNYTTTNGLTNNRVYSIATDPQGNIWFGTEWVISKFDGINWVHNSMNLP